MSASESGDQETAPFDTRTSYYKAGTTFTSASIEQNPTEERCSDFLIFLAVAQMRGIDYLPITWQPALETVGIGATADIRQSLINLQLSFAFKRIHLERLAAHSRRNAFRALTSEVFVLGHPEIQNHPNIIRLEGVCWEFKDEEVWPVLVFQKSALGDLKRFMTTGTGKAFNIQERLALCFDIAAALMAMHSFHIIHGDMKPENVLVFANEIGGYIARVSDFGYSTVVLHPEKGRVHLPKSQPWNAPEVVHWEDAFSFAAAKQADIYSFAMLCLWILFQNSLESTEMPADSSFNTKTAENNDLALLRYMKEAGTLYAFARSQIEMCELRHDERLGLASFFKWALADLAENRRIDPAKLEHAQAISRQNAIPEVEFGTAHQAPELLGLEFLYVDTQELTKLFPSSSAPLLSSETFDNSEQLFERSHFKFTEEFPHIISSDYRLWYYIFECFNSQATSQLDGNSTRNAAFQLAFCSELGFCSPRSKTETQRWLEKSQRSYGDLEQEIEKIKSLKTIKFKNLGVQIDPVNYVNEYRRVNMLQDALVAYTSTLSEMKCSFGEMHTITTQLKSRMAQILNGLGRFEDEEKHLMQASKDYELELGSENAHTLSTLAKLAGNYNDQGKWEKAEELGIYLIEKYDKIKGPTDEISILCRVNLAYTYWLQAKWKDAEVEMERVLENRKASRGPDHPLTLSTMINLASFYDYQGQTEKAEKMKTGILDTCLKVLGREHPYTVAAMGNLAGNYRLQKRFKETERLELQVREIRERTHGREHPFTLKSIGNLASTYSLQGRWTEALELDEYALETSLRVLGDQHPDAVTAMNNVAHTYHGLQRYDEALGLMENVVGLREKILGPDHPNTLTSSRNLRKWRAEYEMRTSSYTSSTPVP